MAVGLGANLGDARASLARAASSLARLLDALRLSPLYRTAPVGGPPQPDYWNAAAIGDTALPADALLGELQALERAAGRVATPVRDAPRALDLDLLLFGDAVIATDGLVVPHPRLAERRFVLAPLADLAPDFVVPGLGRTVRQLLAAAPVARVARVAPAGWADPAPARIRSGAS